MEETTRFQRYTKLGLTSIPTYPLDFFIFKQSPPVKIITEKNFILDEDITFAEQPEGYVITLFAPNKIIAKKLRRAISTLFPQKFFKNFTVTTHEEAVIIRGSLEILRMTTQHLQSSQYITQEKYEDLSKKIEVFLQVLDSETESSASTSSERESPRENDSSASEFDELFSPTTQPLSPMSLCSRFPGNSPHHN